MSICGDTEKAAKTVRGYFPVELADAVHRILCDPSQSLRKAFAPLPCYDCAHCQHRDATCDYPNNEAAFGKIQSSIAKSRVDQRDTLAFFKHFGS